MVTQGHRQRHHGPGIVLQSMFSVGLGLRLALSYGLHASKLSS